jgi:hypothetical protein
LFQKLFAEVQYHVLRLGRSFPDLIDGFFLLPGFLGEEELAKIGFRGSA